MGFRERQGKRMARKKSQMQFLKRQRELRKAEKKGLKQVRRDERRGEATQDGSADTDTGPVDDAAPEGDAANDVGQ